MARIELDARAVTERLRAAASASEAPLAVPPLVDLSCAAVTARLTEACALMRLGLSLAAIGVAESDRGEPSSKEVEVD